MKKILILVLTFSFLILNFEFCYGAAIVKDTQADFTVDGSLFENTNATIEPGNVILNPSGGEGLWATDGVVICAAAGDQYSPQSISDGSGGAIITWFDNRNSATTKYDIYAQRIYGNGVAQWTADGVAVCTATGDQYSPRLISDESGGAIIAWWDGRSGNYDIYAQRIDGNGVPQWTENGVTVCAAAGSQIDLQLISDGSGGAIITWFDNRNSATTKYDIYAQRIDGNGVAQWTPDGVAVCTASNDQYAPRLISDGSGGAIITWFDDRNSATTKYDIYAQRIDGNGVAQWTPDGVAVCAADRSQSDPQLISDGSGGAIIAWRDDRSGNYDIYAQRIDSGSNAQWATNGTAICTAANDQTDLQMTPDGSGGAIMVWDDNRINVSYWDIYAQKIDSSGSVQWAENGAAVCAATENQSDPQPVSDGGGGAIITWYDFRSGAEFDIYAQRITDVYFPSGSYTTEKIENTDAAFSGWTTLSWAGSGSISAEVRTAASYGGLSSATWASAGSGGDIPNRDSVNYKWLQARMYFAPIILKTVTSRLESLSLNYATDTAGTGDVKAVNVISGPSPFNPAVESTTIAYELSRDAAVQIYIFSLSGELIIRKEFSPPEEGARFKQNRVLWDGRNQAGEIVPNGAYLYKITADKKVLGSGKIMVIK